MVAPLPNVPTDNLYKFLALFGLVLIVSGFVLQFQSMQEESTAVTDARVSQQLVNRALTRLESNIEMLTDSERQQSKYRAPLDSQLAAVLHLERQATIDGMRAELASHRGDLAARLYFSMIFVGSLISVAGFRLWYIKLQKYQDLLIQEQASTGRSRES